jgi:hypothetical protein
MMLGSEHLLSTAQAATVLGVTPDRVRQLATSGQPPAVQSTALGRPAALERAPRVDRAGSVERLSDAELIELVRASMARGERAAFEEVLADTEDRRPRALPWDHLPRYVQLIEAAYVRWHREARRNEPHV